MGSIKSSAGCCIYLLTLLTNVSVKTNSVDSDQTALQEQYDLGLHCIEQEASNISAHNKSR